MSTRDKLKRLNELKEQARLGGGAERIQAQHDKGKLTARERLHLLLDPGTFEEVDTFVTHRETDFGLADKHYPGDAVVCGAGRIDGRLVYVYSHDFTVLGGTISEVVGQKVSKVMELALRNEVPIIGINDSGGARIQEGVGGLCGVGETLWHNTLCSGVIPQISIMMGPSAGGAVYSPALTDFVFMVKGTGQMYLTGPDVIKSVTGEEISHEELGGALVHIEKSGVAHFLSDTEEECCRQVRKLLGFLPPNSRCKPPVVATPDDPDRTDEGLLDLVPDNARMPYDMKKLITSVVDNSSFLEVQSHYAQNIIIGLGRLAGQPVGIVAQQPAYLAGVIDINAAVKAARFVRFCDCFNIPIVSLVDVPGFMPGTDQEHHGIIRHGAKLIYAYSEATVPKISVIVRKAYGGAYIVMGSKHLRGDLNYAWPNAEIAVVGPEGAASIVFRREINQSPNPEETRQKLADEYREKFANPYLAAAKGYIDDVIDPRETRPRLIRALAMLENKKDYNQHYRKHGNIPL